MDLLALIAAEPTLLPLWAVLVFAAGMYPVGMLFSCTPCCSPCSACEEGTLPETITVTLDGFTDQSQGPDLCVLNFDSCYGDGAAGKVTAPGGDPDTDKGPITAVSLTNGGSGYARLGRAEPTLTATGSGDGATFAVTVEASEDACGIDFWKVSKVTASGGTGYTDGEQLTITVAEGDTAEQGATVTIKTTRSAPTLAVAVNSYGGFGSAFTVATNPNPGTPATWAAASVTVTEGGSGYADFEGVTVTGDTDRDMTVGAATGYIRTGRLAPTVEVIVASSVGSGAVLAATLTTGTGSSSGRPVWIVDAITITDGGADYEVGDGVYVPVTDGTQEWSSSFEATVDAVDASGAIESVTVTSGGEYYKDSGEIDEVVLEQYGTYFGGSYYHDDGVASVATVASGGVYYREDPEQPPYVADVTVAIDQTAPSAGGGAEITATVEDDPDSPDFGKIVGLTIANGGDDYLAWRWLATACCGHYMNGKPITLKRNGCVYTHTECGGYTFSENGTGASWTHTVRVTYNGPTQPPTAAVFGSSPCARTFTTQSLITDCGDFAFTASSPDGVTASVAPGGDYIGPPTSEDCCHPCCRRDEPPPEEIAVEVLWANDMPPRFYTRWSNAGTYPNGTYVLAKAVGLGCLGWAGNGFSVRLETCDFSCQQCLKTCKVVITTPLVIVVIRGMGDTPWNSPFQGLQDERFLSFPGRPPNVEASACGEECVDACISTTPSCSPVSSTQYDFGFWAYNELFTGVVNSGVVWMNAPWWRENVRGGYYGDSCNFQNGYFEWIYSQIPCDPECDGPFNQCCQGNAPWDASIPMWNPLKYLELHPNYEDSWYGRNNTDGGFFTNRTQAGYEEYLHEMASGASALYPWTVVLPKSFRWSGIAKLTISDAQ
jgi:hypothetical protein